MATASNAEPGSDAEPESTAQSESDGQSTSSASTIADRLATAARVIWWSFLALVVVFTLIPVVGLWLGAVPFDPPAAVPYFALVGLAVLGTAARIAAAVYDV